MNGISHLASCLDCIVTCKPPIIIMVTVVAVSITTLDQVMVQIQSDVVQMMLSFTLQKFDKQTNQLERHCR